MPGAHQKGEERMPDDRTILMEVDRFMNLVRGFGWVKVKEEIRDDDIYITCRKMFEDQEVKKEGVMP